MNDMSDNYVGSYSAFQGEVVIKQKKKPCFFHRLFYKYLLGLEWKDNAKRN